MDGKAHCLFDSFKTAVGILTQRFELATTSRLLKNHRSMDLLDKNNDEIAKNRNDPISYVRNVPDAAVHVQR